MNVLSLFAGIGGLELGLERAGMTVVGQVEINPFCRQVLGKHWPDVPRHDDVRTTVEWWESENRPDVDVVCGGFPCQDISEAGKRVGIRGSRSGLWTAMRDTIRDLRPQFVVVENVAALAIRGLDVVLGDLREIGFDAEWSTVSACTVGAPHPRERLFIVAYPEGSGFGGMRSARPQGELAGRGPKQGRAWASEPRPSGVAYGIPDRLERNKALGNAVVPAVSELVGRRLLEAS